MGYENRRIFKRNLSKNCQQSILLLIFHYKFTEPELALNYIIDNNNNSQNLAKKIIDFKNCAQKIGFNVVCRKTDTIGSIAIGWMC